MHCITFHVSRRVPVPPCELPALATALGSPHRSEDALELGDAGFLVLDGPFVTMGCALPLTGAPASLTAAATLQDRRGRRVCRVEVELSSWSHTASEVAVRPAARRPTSWSGRKQRRYFAGAHAAADVLRQELTVLSWAHALEDLPAQLALVRR